MVPSLTVQVLASLLLLAVATIVLLVVLLSDQRRRYRREHHRLATVAQHLQSQLEQASDARNHLSRGKETPADYRGSYQSHHGCACCQPPQDQQASHG